MAFSVQDAAMLTIYVYYTINLMLLPRQGFAYSGGGRGIARVDVSADGGKTWKTGEQQMPACCGFLTTGNE
jgi:hypothetical protein